MNSNQCTTIVVSNDRHYFISLKKLRRVLANINVIYIKRHNCCMLFVRCASTRDVAYALNLHHNNIFNYSVRIARRDTVIPVIYESDQHTFSHIVPSATNIIPEIRTNTFVERREELGTSSNINNDNHELPETSDISSLSSSLYFSFSSSTSFSFSSSTNISSHTDRETCEESNNHPVWSAGLVLRLSIALFATNTPTLNANVEPITAVLSAAVVTDKTPSCIGAISAPQVIYCQSPISTIYDCTSVLPMTIQTEFLSIQNSH